MGWQKLTQHGYERMAERMNLIPSSSRKMAKRALETGFKICDATGPLNRYLEDHASASSEPIVHGEFVYIFSLQSKPSLITVLNLPNEHKKQANKIRKRLNL